MGGGVEQNAVGYLFLFFVKSTPGLLMLMRCEGYECQKGNAVVYLFRKRRKRRVFMTEWRRKMAELKDTRLPGRSTPACERRVRVAIKRFGAQSVGQRIEEL